MSPVVIGVLGYVAVQLGIGFWVSRRIRSEDDYLVAGRSLGYPLAIFTIFATWFGAETCIGAAGAIYADGLSGGTADPFGYAGCIFAMGLFFAVPLWRRRLTTAADFFRQRYSVSVERFAVLLMAPTSLLWAAAQIRAFGQVLSVASGVDLTVTLTAAAAIVVIYTMFGGLLADAWTDLVQGIALTVGLLVLFVAVLFSGGGWAALGAVEMDRLSMFGPDTTWLGFFEGWAIPVCGSVFAAELIARIIATRSPVVARRSTLSAAWIYLALGMIPVTLGLVGPSLVPGLDHPEQILPVLASEYLGPVLYTLFAGALVSAILSTVDSALLVASSLVSHNVLVPLLPGISESGKVRLARGGVAVFGVLAYVMAFNAESVYGLVEEASAFGSSGIFVVMVAGLFTRIGRGTAAMAALLAGIGTWVVGAYLVGLAYPFLASLVASAVGFAVGAWVEAMRSRQTGRVSVEA